MKTQMLLTLTWFFCLNLLQQCNSQDVIKPKFEAAFKLGTNGFFEKDLAYIKGQRDNQSYQVKNFSFLPAMMWASGDTIVLFDKFSGNMILYHTNLQKAESLGSISKKVKELIVPFKHNIDLIDVHKDMITFFDKVRKRAIIYSFKTSLEVCSTSMQNPIAIKYDPSTDTLTLYSYQTIILTKKCKVGRQLKNKRIPVNENTVFLRFNNELFYQLLNQGNIRSIDLNDRELNLRTVELGANELDKEYSLVHVNSTFYIVASNFEKGLGEFIFIDKRSKEIVRRLNIDQSILQNNLVDFYDAVSNYPAPDVDDPNSYVRLVESGGKYFIFFQTNGTLKLYSFTI